jgi:DNA-binding response OmpR family regulator
MRTIEDPTMPNSYRQEHILLVANDETLCEQMTDTLRGAGGYNVSIANTFEDALSEILLSDFDLVVTQAELPDLSGMDLLAVIGGLRPNTRVIIVDDDLSPKSAVAVYRLGALDYLYKPLNMSFFLMQIERHLEAERAQRRSTADVDATTPAGSGKKLSKSTSFEARAKRLDPTTRSAALVLNRGQFEQINVELRRLLNHVKASFVGLVDADGNLVGAAGSLEDFDLQSLSSALHIDHAQQQSLASILEEEGFHATYFEGRNSGVYIIEFGGAYAVSLAVICDSDVKPGMVWLYSKRTANIIDSLLKSIAPPRRLPRLSDPDS